MNFYKKLKDGLTYGGPIGKKAYKKASACSFFEPGKPVLRFFSTQCRCKNKNVKDVIFEFNNTRWYYFCLICKYYKEKIK